METVKIDIYILYMSIHTDISDREYALLALFILDLRAYGDAIMTCLRIIIYYG